MPFALARYWDSLESADYLDDKHAIEEINEIDETSLDILQKGNVDICHQQWLSELSLATEHECHSILYAKSLLGDISVNSSFDNDDKLPSNIIHMMNRKDLDRISIKNSPPTRKSSYSSLRSRSQSETTTSVPSIPPPKPQRQFARKKNEKVETSRKNDKWAATYSTLDLIESCKFTESQYASIDGWRQANQTQSTLALNSPDRTTNTTASWTPPGLRFRRVDSSLPQLNCSASSSATTINRRPQLPNYEQLTIRVEKTGTSKVVGRKPTVINRQTVAVSPEDVDRARRLCNEVCLNDSNNRVPCIIPPASPKSMNSDSTLSVDSGQCSGDLALNSFSSSREEKETDPCNISTYQTYQQRCLPSYPRMASAMDHVLRTASTIYTLFSQPYDQETLKELQAKATVFMQVLESSPCLYYLPKSDISVVKTQIADMQRSSVDEMSSSLGSSNYFVIIVRKMVEQVLQLFAKIICKHISECGNKDRLLVIALEHLIHIILFGDELCLETIQIGGLTSSLKLIRAQGTPNDTCRLLLRTMAVLCGVSKGCLSLLSFGGLDIILHHLGSSSSSCAIEASGVLTQLTNPQHSFVQLHNLENILARLLELVDICINGESLLLVSAALANVTLQNQGAVDMLYRLNAISRLIQAYNREFCSTIFVQEQVVTTLSRLAARRYEEALIAQGAIPVLLEMLTVTDKTHTDYCRRIRYKAAVCIGTLAATGIGLKAVYNHHGYAILCHVLEMESSTANPLNMICTSIRNKLEGKYRIESAV